MCYARLLKLYRKYLNKFFEKDNEFGTNLFVCLRHTTLCCNHSLNIEHEKNTLNGTDGKKDRACRNEIETLFSV